MRGARSRARFEEHGVHMHLGNSNEHRRGVTVEPLDRARVRPPGLAGRQRTFERGICNLLLVDGSVRTLSMPTNSANFILLLPSLRPQRDVTSRQGRTVHEQHVRVHQLGHQYPAAQLHRLLPKAAPARQELSSALLPQATICRQAAVFLILVFSGLRGTLE